MSEIVLHVFPPSPNARMVLIAADEAGVDTEQRNVDLFSGQQKSPEFLALNPNGRMPVLEDGDFVLWESTAIMQYLASKQAERKLWPEDARAQADVGRWLAWRLAHWGPTCGTFVFQNMIKPMSGQGDPDPGELAKGSEALATVGKVLDDHLRGKEFLVGSDLTLADIAIGSWLTYRNEAKMPIGDFPEVVRWHDSLEARPAWKKNPGLR